MAAFPDSDDLEIQSLIKALPSLSQIQDNPQNAELHSRREQYIEQWNHLNSLRQSPSVNRPQIIQLLNSMKDNGDRLLKLVNPQPQENGGVRQWFTRKFSDLLSRKPIEDPKYSEYGQTAVDNGLLTSPEQKTKVDANVARAKADVDQFNEDAKFFWDSQNNKKYADALVQANGNIKSLPPEMQQWIKDYETRHQRYFGSTGEKPYYPMKDTRDNIQALYGQFGYSKMAGLEPEQRGEEFLKLAKQMYSTQIDELEKQYLTAGTGKSLAEIANAYASIDTGDVGSDDVIKMTDGSGQKVMVPFSEIENTVKMGCEEYYRLVAFENYLEEHMRSGTIDLFMQQAGMEGEYDYVSDLLKNKIPQDKQNYINELNALRAEYLPQIQKTMKSLYSDEAPKMPEVRQYYSGLRRAKGNWQDEDYGYAAQGRKSSEIIPAVNVGKPLQQVKSRKAGVQE